MPGSFFLMATIRYVAIAIQIVFGAHHEIGSGLIHFKESLKIEIATIH